jgi:hypothetical protein
LAYIVTTSENDWCLFQPSLQFITAAEDAKRQFAGHLCSQPNCFGYAGPGTQAASIYHSLHCFSQGRVHGFALEIGSGIVTRSSQATWLDNARLSALWTPEIVVVLVTAWIIHPAHAAVAAYTAEPFRICVCFTIQAPNSLTLHVSSDKIPGVIGSAHEQGFEAG